MVWGTKVKTALCLSGQPRYLSRTVEAFHKYVIGPLDCDVYCHFWKKSPPEYVDNWKPELSLEWTLDYDAIGMLDANKLVLEEQIYFAEGRNYPNAACSIHTTLSMFYSIWQANSLQQDSGKQYDLVIRARTDSLFERVLEVPLLEGDAAYVEFRGTSGDQFAYGPPEPMNNFSSCYTNIDMMCHELGIPFQSETMVAENMKHYGMRLLSAPYVPILLRLE